MMEKGFLVQLVSGGESQVNDWFISDFAFFFRFYLFHQYTL